MTSTSEMSSTEYEQLVQGIYAILTKAAGLHTLRISQNVLVADRFGQEHQIDVFWEFEIAGVPYRTAIECKRYRKPVSKEKVATFASVLNSIGNINGIMVTSAGFQSGAEEYANNNNIRLVVARTPTEKDLEGILLKIVINLHIHVPNVVSIKPSTSKSWAESKRIDAQTPLTIQLNEDGGLYDAQGILLSNWSDIARSLKSPPQPVDVKFFRYTHEVDTSGQYMKHSIYGLMPITKLVITVDTHVIKVESRVNSPLINAYVMKDIQSRKINWIYPTTEGLSLEPYQP